MFVFDETINSTCLGDMHLLSGTDLNSATQSHLGVFLPLNTYMRFSAARS